MKDYDFPDLYVGLEECFDVTMDGEKFDLFLKLSGDCNPLHTNREYALSRGFPGRVMYGMAVASLYSTLAGMYLPGEKCLLHSVKTDFNKPVYEGDRLTVSGRITKNLKLLAGWRSGHRSATRLARKYLLQKLRQASYDN